MTLAGVWVLVLVLALAAKGAGAAEPPPAAMAGGLQLPARTHGAHLEVWRNNGWHSLFIAGVNLGQALPGRTFGQPPKEAAVYRRWFTQMQLLGINAVRLYSLGHPAFYQALRAHNLAHPEQPLWLLQEVWPEENPAGNDYLAPGNLQPFLDEIRRNVDALHGAADIPRRPGRGWGRYTADVYPWLLGWLVGRELEPYEVATTDRHHPGFHHAGRFLAAPNGSPTENWLARCMDQLVERETRRYGWQHPVALVSWPTLDPVEHASETTRGQPKADEHNDSATVDIRHFRAGPELRAGFFGAYHIYPNYPEFMNHEPAYDDYRDPLGRLRYGGYLREFLARHRGIPAVVAEFGLATGLGYSQTSPDGYSHGGLSEEAQGRGVARLLRAIHREGAAGGVVFEWMDEWAKKTWITAPYMIPYARHPLWHNVVDPEQNYGLLATECAPPPAAPQQVLEGTGRLHRLELRANAAFLFLDFEFAGPPPDWRTEELLIGLDTYARDRGETRYRPDLAATPPPSGLEFLVRLAGPDNGRLLASPAYNLGTYHFASAPGGDGRFEEIRRPIREPRLTADGRFFPADFEDASRLRHGAFDASLRTLNNWVVDGNRLHLRLPWARLNVTDPSSHHVLDEPRPFKQRPALGRDELRAVATDGFVVSAVLAAKDRPEVVGRLPAAGRPTPPPFLWPGWDRPPDYQQRLKLGAPHLRAAIAEVTAAAEPVK